MVAWRFALCCSLCKRTKEAPDSCELEAKRGGRIYEKVSDGTEHDWGNILIREPPSRLAFTWHPGRDEAVSSLWRGDAVEKIR